MAYRYTFEPDKIWGTIFIVLYSLMLAVALLFVLGIGGFLTLSAADHGPFPMLAGGAITTIVAIFVVAALGIHIVGAAGISKSRPWGFWLTIILSILSLAGSAGATCLTIGPLIYSILRLCGAYGPKPG